MSSSEHPQPVDCLAKLQALVAGGFTGWSNLGAIRVKQHADLLFFNYTSAAERRGRWNFVERVSRGLILHRQSGEVIARPFDKFFHWNEGGRTSQADLVRVTEKMDGALGIVYRNGDRHAVATRNGPNTAEAQCGSGLLGELCEVSAIPDALTLLVEIVAPRTRGLVDYGDRSELILLGARDRKSGDYVAPRQLSHLAQQTRLPLVQEFSFRTVADLLRAAEVLSAHAEGWVAEFADGIRFKFKGRRYLDRMKTRARLSHARVARALVSGSITSLRSEVPS